MFESVSVAAMCVDELTTFSSAPAVEKQPNYPLQIQYGSRYFTGIFLEQESEDMKCGRRNVGVLYSRALMFLST